MASSPTGEETIENYRGDAVALIQSAQLSRTCIVSLLSEPNFPDLVRGGFVRVLLELEDGLEDYCIGIIAGTESGTAYSGFTHDRNAQTTTYLVLELPGEQLHQINGCSFQLNSVSNSLIQQGEWDSWRRSKMKLNMPVSRIHAKAEQIRPFMERVQSQRRGARGPPAGLAAAPLNATSSPARAVEMATVLAPREASGGRQRAPPKHDPEPSAEDEAFAPEYLRRIVLEELREHNQLFPKEIASMKTGLLRILERDILDYLDRVREAMRSKMSNCVVCMDRPPTVISLPCKHKVLCRLCATVVRCCPVCRESVVELFEPVES